MTMLDLGDFSGPLRRLINQMSPEQHTKPLNLDQENLLSHNTTNKESKDASRTLRPPIGNLPPKNPNIPLRERTPRLTSPHHNTSNNVRNVNVRSRKPEGSVPILSLGDGRFVKQSLAILEYFEDICNEAELSGRDAFGKRVASSKRGKTADGEARVRDMLSIADEASTHFGVACHKGTALFSMIEAQNAAASAIAMSFCMKQLALLETYYAVDDRFEEEEFGEVQATIADCVPFSLLQFAKNLYGKDLVADLPYLKRFYDGFEKRDSARIGEDFYPL